MSKWERGLSCPDVSLLSPLAARLGVSVEELLQGGAENSLTGASPAPEAETPSPFSLRRMRFQKYAPRTCILLFSMSGGICAICDYAICGALTWSLYPILSLVFASGLILPLLMHGGKGLLYSLIAFSLSIFPFLFLLGLILPECPLFLPIALRMAGIALAFFWCVFALFRRLAPHHSRALAYSMLLCIPVNLAVNFCLSRLIDTPMFDGWDILTCLVLLALAALFFCFDRRTPHTS